LVTNTVHAVYAYFTLALRDKNGDRRALDDSGILQMYMEMTDV